MFKRFLITSDIGSIEVFFGPGEMRWYDECKTDAERRELIAHEAWRRLYDSPAKRMLTLVCNKIGASAAKKQFLAMIHIEEIP